jgi:hypothetical protein
MGLDRGEGWSGLPLLLRRWVDRCMMRGAVNDR